MQKHRIQAFLLKVAVCGSLLAGCLALTPVPRAEAADGCQKRLIHADHELHRAIEKHGYESSQAEHWRHELREARTWCWEHGHRWWNEDEHRWHSDRDWDDHDHDKH